MNNYDLHFNNVVHDAAIPYKHRNLFIHIDDGYPSLLILYIGSYAEELTT